FSDQEHGKRVSRATGNDELAARVTAETENDIFDGGGLMGSWFFPGERLGWFADPGRPFYLGVQKSAAQDQANGFFLACQRFQGVAADVVRRGDDQAVVKLR